MTRCNNVSSAAEVTQIRQTRLQHQSPDKYRSATLRFCSTLGARDAGMMRIQTGCNRSIYINIHHLSLFYSIKCEYLNMQSAHDDAHHHLTAECWHFRVIIPGPSQQQKHIIIIIMIPLWLKKAVYLQVRLSVLSVSLTFSRCCRKTLRTRVWISRYADGGGDVTRVLAGAWLMNTNDAA